MAGEEKFDLSEIRDFIERRIWRQIADDCLTRALIASEENDLLDPLQEPVKIARNQGEITALKWVVDLPKVMKEEVEQSKRKEGKDE